MPPLPFISWIISVVFPNPEYLEEYTSIFSKVSIFSSGCLTNLSLKIFFSGINFPISLDKPEFSLS